ncbi:hypothetical protein, partial [Treponema berlinense]|uniref:hypothetical protein n=1 Tax=Treponema berlinense TaxID=225004 RepID=UPI0023F85410
IKNSKIFCFNKPERNFLTNPLSAVPLYAAFGKAERLRRCSNRGYVLWQTMEQRQFVAEPPVFLNCSKMSSF